MERHLSTKPVLSIAVGHRHATPWPDLAGQGWGPGADRHLDAASFWTADDRARREVDLGRVALALVVAGLGFLIAMTLVGLAFIGYFDIPLPVVVAVLVGGLVVGALARPRPMAPALPRISVPVPEVLSDVATEVAVAAGRPVPRILIADLDDAEPWAAQTPHGTTIAIDITDLRVLDREEWQAIIALLLARTRYAGQRRLLLRYQVADMLEATRDLFFLGSLVEPGFWGAGPSRQPGPDSGLVFEPGNTWGFVGAALALIILFPIVMPFALIRLATTVALRTLLLATREEILRADAASVALMRNASALAWALAHLTEPSPARPDERTAPQHLDHAAAYAVPPSHARFGPTAYDFPPVAERIARLRAIGS
jgi:hypothetical protein